MTEFDTTKLNQSGSRKLTPHDNCTVLDIGSGSYPRLIEIRLPGTDGSRQSALWDGMLALAVDDIVIADEYAGQTVWRVSSMGGDASGFGKVKVSQVWESDFENVIFSIDDDGLSTLQPSSDNVGFYKISDSLGSLILNVDTVNQRVSIGGETTPESKLHLTANSDSILTVDGTHSGVLCNFVPVNTGGGSSATIWRQFPEFRPTSNLGSAINMNVSVTASVSTYKITKLIPFLVLANIAATMSGNVTTAYNFFAQGVNHSGSGTLNNFIAYHASDESDANKNYAFYSLMNNGTNKYGLYMSGDADNYLGGKLITANGQMKATTRITNTESPYTVLEADNIIMADSDSGTITVNLPVGIDGTHYRISNTGSSGNTVTVNPNGSQQLFGGGAGVSFDLNDAETMNIYFETTEGWW